MIMQVIEEAVGGATDIVIRQQPRPARRHRPVNLRFQKRSK
jgi:hypothetical protein